MKFDLKLIGYITTFENYTKSKVRDCFFKDNELIIIVQKGNMGKALGKNGINIKQLGPKLKHKLRVIEFNDDPCSFLKNLLAPLDGFNLERVDDSVIIKTEDTRIKGRIFGRDKSNFHWIQEVFQRHFKDLEVKVD